MSQEMNFLPASHRILQDRRRSRQGTFLLAVIVSCGILLTEGALRYRVQSLRSTRRHASQQAAAAAQRATGLEDLNRRQQELIEELVQWSSPLEVQRATEILDGILTSRPATIYLQRVDWSSGSLHGDERPTLRIGGVLQDLGDLVAFLTTMDKAGGLPRLEVRRSSMAGLPTDNSLQTFMVESVGYAGEPR